MRKAALSLTLVCLACADGGMDNTIPNPGWGNTPTNGDGGDGATASGTTQSDDDGTGSAGTGTGTLTGEGTGTDDSDSASDTGSSQDSGDETTDGATSGSVGSGTSATAGTTTGGTTMSDATTTAVGTSSSSTSTDTCRPVLETGSMALITDSQNGMSSVQVSALGCKVAKVIVSLNVIHTCTDDLVIELVSATGTRLRLAEGPGGRCDADMVDTVFDDDGLILIGDGTTPFTGTFRPQQPLLLYNDEDPNGTWTLDIDDRYGGNDGAISNWTLALDLVPQ